MGDLGAVTVKNKIYHRKKGLESTGKTKGTLTSIAVHWEESMQKS